MSERERVERILLEHGIGQGTVGVATLNSLIAALAPQGEPRPWLGSCPKCGTAKQALCPACEEPDDE